MTETNRNEQAESEGLPEVQDHPPGTDIETDEESMALPRDYPIAAGEDPAYPVTGAEEGIDEAVSDRARRENPDVGAAELGVGSGLAGTADDPRLQELRGDPEILGGFSAGVDGDPDDAVPADPLEPDGSPPDAATGAIQLIEAEGVDDGLGAEAPEDDEAGPAPEEQAVTSRPDRP